MRPTRACPSEQACRAAADCDPRRRSPDVKSKRRDSSARLPPSAFVLRRVSSDVWCRATDVASTERLDARGAAAYERREISGVASPEATDRHACSDGDAPLTRSYEGHACQAPPRCKPLETHLHRGRPERALQTPKGPRRAAEPCCLSWRDARMSSSLAASGARSRLAPTLLLSVSVPIAPTPETPSRSPGREPLLLNIGSRGEPAGANGGSHQLVRHADASRRRPLTRSRVSGRRPQAPSRSPHNATTRSAVSARARQSQSGAPAGHRDQTAADTTD